MLTSTSDLAQPADINGQTLYVSLIGEDRSITTADNLRCDISQTHDSGCVIANPFKQAVD